MDEADAEGDEATMDGGADEVDMKIMAVSLVDNKRTMRAVLLLTMSFFFSIKCGHQRLCFTTEEILNKT